MKAAVIFTGTGPILILTTYPSLVNEAFVEKLKTKGIEKFVAYELPIDMVKEKYGRHFTVILNDVSQTDDLRVLDYNGHNVLYRFPLSQVGPPIYYGL